MKDKENRDKPSIVVVAKSYSMTGRMWNEQGDVSKIKTKTKQHSFVSHRK